MDEDYYKRAYETQLQENVEARIQLRYLLIAYIELFKRSHDNLGDHETERYFSAFKAAYSVLDKGGGDVELSELYEDALMLSIPLEKLGCVYVFHRSDGLYKIGCSMNLEKRMRDLTREHGNLELIFLIHTKHHYLVESILHERYEQKRVEGEWFSLNERDINEIKSTYKLLPGVESRILEAGI